MKILFVIAALTDAGGAERVLSLMANYWAERGRQVSIATFDDGSRQPFYPLAEGVDNRPLNLPQASSSSLQGVYSNLLRARRLRQHIKQEKPDLVISFLTSTNLTTLLAARGTSIPVIVSERNHPAYSPIDPLRKKMRKKLYPKAAAVICQTGGILDYFQPLLKHNGRVIPNPVLAPDLSPSLPEIDLPSGPLLLAAGNLSKQKVHQKGFDLLIPAFIKLAAKHSDWHLVILGDGSQRQTLVQKARELNLEQRIHLPGNVNNIEAIYQRADLFVLSSRYEGFPNVLAEAMAAGLPAVSFDCPTGPSDLIRPGHDGLLVPPEDSDQLIEKLDRLMSSAQARRAMGEEAKAITARFNIAKIIEKWDDLVYTVIDRGVKQ